MKGFLSESPARGNKEDVEGKACGAVRSELRAVLSVVRL